MSRTVPRLALAVLSVSAPCLAWSPDELAKDSAVPKEISDQWSAPAAPAPGSGWDKYYFEDEFGSQRTVWCRHKDCDAALQSGDVKRRVPLYYLEAVPPPPEGAPAGTTYWRAVLSAYDVHWEPYKKGGLNDIVSRPGTPLAIRPSRPFKSDDSWNLPGSVVVLPPVEREIPPRVSPMAEARDWPPCWGLAAGSFEGDGKSLKKLSPMEIEIKEASTAGDDQGDLYARFKGLASSPDAASAYLSAEKIRAEAWAAAEKEKAAPAPKDRFTEFEAKFLYCRVKRFDHFRTFETEMKQLSDPAGFVAKWRPFVRGELAAYEKEVDGLPGTPAGARLKSPWQGYARHDYERSLLALEKRTAAALGATLAEGGRAATKPEEMDRAKDRVDSILDKIK